ncbi:MAG: hypothetical protein EZS28_001795 [Streblomastix strix]|uniref:Uncharacterized protein n=1 Tax=Streblomastix strix TaxID=222440 RepID=A0A5J4X675_9EUKA|nr:MAG: hypothetical protein EZS28_001795 [Streblomastix strix]
MKTTQMNRKERTSQKVAVELQISETKLLLLFRWARALLHVDQSENIYTLFRAGEHFLQMAETLSGQDRNETGSKHYFNMSNKKLHHHFKAKQLRKQQIQRALEIVWDYMPTMGMMPTVDEVQSVNDHVIIPSLIKKMFDVFVMRNLWGRAKAMFNWFRQVMAQFGIRLPNDLHFRNRSHLRKVIFSDGVILMCVCLAYGGGIEWLMLQGKEKEKQLSNTNSRASLFDDEDSYQQIGQDMNDLNQLKQAVRCVVAWPQSTDERINNITNALISFKHHFGIPIFFTPREFMSQAPPKVLSGEISIQKQKNEKTEKYQEQFPTLKRQKQINLSQSIRFQTPIKLQPVDNLQLVRTPQYSMSNQHLVQLRQQEEGRGNLPKPGYFLHSLQVHRLLYTAQNNDPIKFCNDNDDFLLFQLDFIWRRLSNGKCLLTIPADNNEYLPYGEEGELFYQTKEELGKTKEENKDKKNNVKQRNKIRLTLKQRLEQKYEISLSKILHDNLPFEFPFWVKFRDHRRLAGGIIRKRKRINRQDSQINFDGSTTQLWPQDEQSNDEESSSEDDDLLDESPESILERLRPMKNADSVQGQSDDSRQKRMQDLQNAIDFLKIKHDIDLKIPSILFPPTSLQSDNELNMARERLLLEQRKLASEGYLISKILDIDVDFASDNEADIQKMKKCIHSYVSPHYIWYDHALNTILWEYKCNNQKVIQTGSVSLDEIQFCIISKDDQKLVQLNSKADGFKNTGIPLSECLVEMKFKSINESFQFNESLMFLLNYCQIDNE